MEVGPLASFPVLRDLVIDRRPLVERFARWGLYLLPPEGEVSPASFEVPDVYGELAACTECLACMAGCPSFDLENRSFGGPLTFVKLAALHFDPRDGEDRRAQAEALGLATCRSCETRCACPVGVPIYRAAIEPLLQR